MAEIVVKILECWYISHDVKCFRVEKPKGFKFIPGQATDVSINLPEWKDKLRPFSFTALNEWPFLEFIIKIYDDHNGVTHQLGKTNAGAELILHDTFGSIQYKGPGIFIAGGAGITPFIAIFRELNKQKKLLPGNALIFSNKTAHDIILAEELAKMLGPAFINVFTRQGVIGFRERRIDREYLVETIRDFSQHFYVCGPEIFVKDIVELLLNLGATAETVIIEK
ncbi:MAG: flavodoxin reductase [Chitinophagaceae bacterium]|nr:flavodoxin reductase [Chitinophagaceae bacterium]